MGFSDTSPKLGDTDNNLLFKIAQILDEGGGVGGGGVASFNARTGAVTLTSGDVTTALGFTPAVAGSGVTSFNARTGAITLELADVSAVADARYVLKVGDTMTGALNINTGTVTIDTPALYLTQTVNDDGSAVFSGIRIDAANTTEDEVFRFLRFRFNSGGGGLVDRFDVTSGGGINADGVSNLRILNVYTGGPFTSTGLKFQVDATGVGFQGTAAQAQKVSGANLTNNVTAGGTDNTIADFTSLSVYATDAATIRNDIYQLARKLKQINDGLRAYGLFT